MARESWESSTITSMCLLQRIETVTRLILAGLSACVANNHRVFGILDDVDLLAAQLADDGLHPHALHAHAGAHAVHVAVAALHGDLGALAGFPGAALDHHRAVVDLRHFLLEQPHHQFRRRARDDHPGFLAGLVHGLDHAAHPVTHARSSPGGTARAWAAALRSCPGPARRSCPSTRLTVQFTSSPARPEYSWKHGFPLGFAHLLQDHLLGGLRRDAAQRVGVLFDAHLGADLGVGVDARASESVIS
jgi:hypothetical protein